MAPEVVNEPKIAFKERHLYLFIYFILNDKLNQKYPYEIVHIIEKQLKYKCKVSFACVE